MIWNHGRYEVIWRLQFFDVRETEDEVAAIEARKRHASFTELLNNDEEWQGESPRHISHDSNETFDVDEFSKDDNPIADSDYTNPMRFPVWPDHNEPSYPGRPLLRLSAGYGRQPFAVAEYSIEYGPGRVSVADQVLLETSEPHLRLDHMVTSKQFLHNTRSGWLEFKSDGSV